MMEEYSIACRSPCGERGLKWLPWASAARGRSSLPVRGAWIEIMILLLGISRDDLSLPVRGAWIEMDSTDIEQLTKRSLPVRGAWIEISMFPSNYRSRRVAPRAGSVD